MTSSSEPSLPASNWPVIWAVFGAGVMAAAHVGKLPPALPAIRAELATGLVMAGWIASMISAVGLAMGLIAGAFADRLDQVQIMVAGLLAMAAGALLGAVAESATVMLISRFIEGIGFTGISVAGVAMVTRASNITDFKRAIGVWATYMPVGFGTMMLIAAVVVDWQGWRALWVFSALITLALIPAILHTARGWPEARVRAREGHEVIRNITRSLGSFGGVLLAACFGLYTAQHISLTNWVPTYLIEIYGVATVLAAGVSTGILVFNGVGNYLTSLLLERGVPIWGLLVAGAAGMGLAELGMFSSALAHEARLGLAIVFGLAGGLVPAAALAGIPAHTPSPGQIATMTGLIVMGSNIGQFFGPPALAAAREQAGSWDGAVWLMVMLSLCGIICGLASRRYEKTR